MISVLLLPIWVFQSFLSATTPPVYPTLLTAMEAGKSAKKDVVIFFESRTCGNCNHAWQTFESGISVTSPYVCTRMNNDDFDGAVVFDTYELKEIPAWVILSPEGVIKDTWTGGWKDASGKPAFIPTALSVKDPSSHPLSDPATPQSPGDQRPRTQQAKEKTGTPVKPQPAASSHVGNPASSSLLKEGYVLQAGYFGSAANADKLVTTLKTKGFDSYRIQPVIQNGSTFHRVVSVVFDSEAEATKEMSRLSGAGYTAALKKSSELK